tara:strand:- start:439 stop:822 length:384 start_codon:yes stop_codon:yes gene_type:complete
MTELKLKISISNQPMKIWSIQKSEKFTLTRASISAGKRKSDGTWDNISQTFSCFLHGLEKADFDQMVAEGMRIKVNGNITVLPEKRYNNNIKEIIFTKPIINIDNFTIIEFEKKSNALEYKKLSQGF